jgi:opacity protein-like surface antigen
MKQVCLLSFLFFLLMSDTASAQADSSKQMRHYKNVIRYNLSSAFIFGADKYIVFGYERVVSSHQSFSINIGGASLPKLVTVNTDSFSTQKDRKRNGYNISADYRFYLSKENTHAIPHGVYIGPYYSYNQFNRETEWTHTGSTNRDILTTSNFSIHTIGFEAGYQFILWKRLALDFVMAGPGLGFYKCKASFDGNVNAEDKEQLLEGVKQLLTQKFPGMDFVFSEKQFDSNGTLKTSAIGYRYIIHIGFLF